MISSTWLLQIGESTSEELATHDGPVNSDTHNVTGQYSLIVKNVDIADEGQYQCSLSAGAITPMEMYLVVSGQNLRLAFL